MAKYLREPSLDKSGGLWIAPRDVIRAGDWAGFTAAARAAVAVWDSEREPT